MLVVEVSRPRAVPDIDAPDAVQPVSGVLRQVSADSRIDGTTVRLDGGVCIPLLGEPPSLACEYQRGRPPRHTVLARLLVQGMPFGGVVVGAHQTKAEQRVVSVVAAAMQGGDGLR